MHRASKAMGLTAALALSATAACGSKIGVDRVVAEKACAHNIELGFWAGFEKQLTTQGIAIDDARRAEAKAHLAEVLASDEYKGQLGKCTDGFAKMATQAQMDCVTGAKSPAEATACLKP